MIEAIDADCDHWRGNYWSDGGSRARAYALTGYPLASEPCCIYQPKSWNPELEHQAAAFAKS